MTTEQQEFENLFKKYQNFAKKNGFRLNPNKKITETLITQLIKRKNKFGKMYCPCRRITGNESVDEKSICPCISCKKEIEEQGHCLCFLFIK